MSKAILWVGLVLAVFMILFMGLGSGKVLPILFWSLIAVGAAYKLFKKPAPEAS